MNSHGSETGVTALPCVHRCESMAVESMAVGSMAVESIAVESMSRVYMCE